jgi:glycogen debranching enzyme
MNTLAVTCEDVLKANDRGTHTVPSPGLYPHQWLWDSCFAAIGWAHINPERAKQELLSLIHGQWHNGMVPHMIFSMDKKYARDRNMWRSWVSPNSPNDVATSGITQPPVLAEAVWRVGNELPANERSQFFTKMYPVLVRYHSWLYLERDPHSEGLALLIHPYETGLDNTPPWEQQLREHSRPFWIAAIENIGLEKYFNMVRRDTRSIPSEQRMRNIDALMAWDAILRLRRKRYDIDMILHRSLFAIEDVGFNAIMVRNNQIIRDIAKIIYRKIPKQLDENMQKSVIALESLWDETYSIYFSRDFITNKLLKQPTISSLLPIYSGVIDKKRAAMLVKIMTTAGAYWTDYPVPSVPKNSRVFNEWRYWQGPTWLNTNWLIIDGLQRNGFSQEAQALISHTLKMVRENGIWEYYNPKTGEGLGSSDFTWTAALTLDLLHQSGEHHTDKAAQS